MKRKDPGKGFTVERKNEGAKTTMELFAASRQWATRPDDQRFWTLAEIAPSCKAYANASKEVDGINPDLQGDCSRGRREIARKNCTNRVDELGVLAISRKGESTFRVSPIPPGKILRRFASIMVCSNSVRTMGQRCYSRNTRVTCWCVPSPPTNMHASGISEVTDRLLRLAAIRLDDSSGVERSGG
jgi:hypothetical protein